MPAAGRIVYVLQRFPELTETFVFREIRALLARGVPVTVLAVAPGKGEALPGLDVRHLPPPIDLPAPSVWADLRRLAGLRQKARALRLAARARVAARLVPKDTVVLHAHFANDAGALARYIASLTGIPYRLTAHAYDLYQDPFLLEENLREAAHVFTVTEENLRWLRQRWDAIPASVLRCGLDLSEHPYRDPAPPGTPPRAVCVARLIEKKGHDVLLAAAALLPGLRLDLVGDGPRRREIEAAAAKLAPAVDVHVHGPLSPSATRDLVRGADVLVLAAKVARDGDRDGLPVALIEAAALGVPLVATAVSGIPELVDGGTGHLVAPEDPPALAAALRASLEAPPQERVARTRAARARVEADYDVSQLVHALLV